MANLRRMLVLIAAIVLGFHGRLAAQENEKEQVKVTRMVFCTEIVGREPLSEETTFENDVEKIFCFTRIEGAQFDMQIRHRWFYKDSLMAEVALPVRSRSWRTYSSKNIMPQWVGEWHVEVVDDEGRLLRTESFTVVKKEGETESTHE